MELDPPDVSASSLYRELNLSDVLTSNLQHTRPLFISSNLKITFDWEQLMNFLQCYGFMMYDRDEKLSMFAQSPWESVRSAASACLSCQDPTTFRNLLNGQLNRIDQLITQEFQTMPENETATLNGSADRIVRAARDALRQLTISLDDDETFVKQMRTNDFYRYVLAPATISTLNDSLSEWKYVAQSSDDESRQLNFFISCVLRDFITTTCISTHSVFALILRMGVLIVFLMTQIARNPSVTLKMFATANELAELNETREKLHESLHNVDDKMCDDEKNYRNMLHDVVDSMYRQYNLENGEERNDSAIASTAESAIFSTPVNGEVFVATTILAVVRGAFASFVNWPERLRQFVSYAIVVALNAVT